MAHLPDPAPPPAAPSLAPAHHRTVLNALWAIANRAVGGIALLAAQALFARALRPGEVGLYHLAAFLGTVAATLGTLGLPSAAIRFVAAELGAGGGRAAGVARRVLELATSALALLLAVLAAATALGPAGWRPAAPAVLVAYAAATGARLVLAGVVQGFADFRGQVVASLGAALVLPAGAVWIVLRGGDATTALAVTALHAAVGAALLGWRARRALRGRPVAPLDPELRRRLVRYALGVSAMLALDAVVWQQSELLFLRALSPAAEVGLYAMAFTLVSQAMQLLPGSVTVALFPALSHAAGAGEPRALRETWDGAVRLLAVAAWPAGAVGAALAPQLMCVLYGEAFLPGASAARVLWVAGAIGAVAAAPSSLLYALERQRAMVLAALPVAALNVALDLVLIPRHGALGAALANAAAQVTGAATVAVLARREVGPSPWASLARVAVASVAAAGAAHLAAGSGLGVAALLRGALAGAAVAALALLAVGELGRLPWRALGRSRPAPHPSPLPGGERETGTPHPSPPPDGEREDLRGGLLGGAALALLYVVAFWLPLQYLPTRSLHLLPLPFIWLDDAALVVAAALAFAVAWRCERRWPRTPLDLPVLACVAAGVLSAALNRVGPAHLAMALRGPLEPVLCFYALFLLRPARRHLAGLGALSLALALLQVPVTVTQFLLTRGAMSRDLVYGTFWIGASNSIAYYLLFFVLPLLGVAAARPARRGALAAAAALMIPFVLASSRGALLLLPCLALVAVWPSLRRHPRALGGVGALAAAALLGLGLFYAYKPAIEGSELSGELSPRRFWIEQWNRDRGMGRLYYARWIAERMAERGPAAVMFGVGPARFSSSAGAWVRAPLLEEATRGGHSPIIPGQLIATVSEYGLAGAAAFAWLVATGLALAWRGWRRAPEDEGGGLRRGVFAAALFLAAGTVLENVWELPHVAMLAWAGMAWCALARPAAPPAAAQPRP